MTDFAAVGPAQLQGRGGRGGRGDKKGDKDYLSFNQREKRKRERGQAAGGKVRIRRSFGLSPVVRELAGGRVQEAAGALTACVVCQDWVQEEKRIQRQYGITSGFDM